MDLIDRNIDTEELDLMVDDQRCIGRGQARLAARMVAFDDRRNREGERCLDPRVGNLEASYAADEIGAALGLSTKRVRDQIAQTRRVQTNMPNVWMAWRAGDVDQFQVWKIDTAALRLVRPESVTLLDEQVVTYVTSHTTAQLQSWLNRFVARMEADEFARRHQQVLKDRYVSVGHDPDGVAWISGMTSSFDATQIDTMLTKLARGLGANDPRTMDQRRADIYADLLTGRMQLVDGELRPGAGPSIAIGVVVPIDTLCGLGDAPGELLDRTTSIPAAFVRELAAEAGTLFYRLLTDPMGNLLDVTELGRFPSKHLNFALTVRDGECAFPTCTAPAERCDIDHIIPSPDGPTEGANLRHLCRRHHRAKTFGAFGVSNDADGYRWHLPGNRAYEVHDARLPVGRQCAYSRSEAIFGEFIAEYEPP
ncbi:MAG: DUF222 domain-containing protein [Propionibacteriales bacterium]|nr:DUF222 domain-containing protein [Propionibacteriales bacterium]